MATPLRKSSRTLKPSLKAKEAGFVESLKSSGVVQAADSDENFTDEEEYLKLLEDVEKPTVLHENEIVPGEDIFKFQTRKQKDGLAHKVAEACSLKTPHAVRHKTKSKLVKLIEESSDSDYSPSDKSSSSSCSSSEDEDRSSESGSEVEESAKAKSSGSILNLKGATLAPMRTRGQNKYVINTEEYFSQSVQANKTSNNTLDKLETPRLPQFELQKLLKNKKISIEHELAEQSLLNKTIDSFRKWYYFLNENFNIILYGLGSKKDILKKFQEMYLNHMPVVVVNGYFPTLTIKNVLESIIVDLFELDDNPTNPYEACDIIIQEFQNYPDSHIYIIVHNIEGEMIRNAKAQNVLAKLASTKNIHLIASIDHINGPLIWDQNRLGKFKFIWWDVTSFLPYTEETSFERSMMVQQTGALALSSLKNIFLSLTSNSKRIYMIIAKYQLEHLQIQYYQGLPFRDLYVKCRENFIVSSDLALRAQLTEFIDHKMVKMKRSAEGTEMIIIPLAENLLQKFVEENLS